MNSKNTGSNFTLPSSDPCCIITPYLNVGGEENYILSLLLIHLGVTPGPMLLTNCGQDSPTVQKTPFAGLSRMCPPPAPLLLVGTAPRGLLSVSLLLKARFIPGQELDGPLQLTPPLRLVSLVTGSQS